MKLGFVMREFHGLGTHLNRRSDLGGSLKRISSINSPGTRRLLDNIAIVPGFLSPTASFFLRDLRDPLIYTTLQN